MQDGIYAHQEERKGNDNWKRSSIFHVVINSPLGVPVSNIQSLLSVVQLHPSIHLEKQQVLLKYFAYQPGLSCCLLTLAWVLRAFGK